MNIPVFGFIPPVTGVDNLFNTFRLGEAYTKRVTVGMEVFLMDEKTKTIFGRAEVTRVEKGTLGELCLIHGKDNHREIGNEPIGAPARLLTYIQKIYGPHIAPTQKKSAVFYMKRIE